MDQNLRDFMSKDSPKLNPYLANGLAVYHMRESEKYLDDIIRDVFKNSVGGVRYIGFKRISPREEYDQTKKKTGKNKRYVFDLAKSDLYMIKVMFEFTDPKDGVVHPINRYLYLPNVGEGGGITLSAAKYFISPVLADKVISIGMNNIFVRLLCDKLTFERLNQTIVIDGVRESIQVPWAAIYHKNDKARSLRPKVKAHTTIAHYLFCRYGFTKTLQKFCNVTPIVGNEEINYNSYPASEWTIFSTAFNNPNIKPKGCRGVFGWTPTTIKIAIRKEEVTNKVKSIIAGFYYVTDHYSDRVSSKWVDNEILWKRILGIAIFSETVSEGRLLEDINEHFRSLDNYVDPYASIKLRSVKRVDRPINDIYQLFDLIIDNINTWLLNASEDVNTMYEKEFSILYFVLMEITRNIYLLYYKLTAASKKGLTLNEVNNIMNMTLRVGLIHAIRRSHGEVRVQTTSGDNKALKITSILVPQSSSNMQSNRKDRTAVTDPSKRLHASIAEVGGYLNLPKNEPSGRSRVNLCQQLEGMENVYRNPRFIELLDSIQARIQRA